MGSIQDWAAKAACRIVDEYDGRRLPLRLRKDQNHISAIIATFAEPLVSLLRESRRVHHHVADGDVRDGVCCPQCCCESWPDDPEGDFEAEPNSDEPCTCDAAEWNARIDKALS